MTDKELLVSQLIRLGYSQAEAEAIVARNEIASTLVRQGIPLERAISLANQIVEAAGSIEGSGGNPNPSAGLGGAAFDAGKGTQAPDTPSPAAPVTGGIAPSSPFSATPGVHADGAPPGTIGATGKSTSTGGIAPGLSPAEAAAIAQGIDASVAGVIAASQAAGQRGGVPGGFPGEHSDVGSQAGQRGGFGFDASVSPAHPGQTPNPGFTQSDPGARDAGMHTAGFAQTGHAAQSAAAQQAADAALAAPKGDAPTGLLGSPDTPTSFSVGAPANIGAHPGLGAPAGMPGMGFDAGGILGGGLMGGPISETGFNNSLGVALADTGFAPQGQSPSLGAQAALGVHAAQAISDALGEQAALAAQTAALAAPKGDEPGNVYGAPTGLLGGLGLSTQADVGNRGGFAAGMATQRGDPDSPLSTQADVAGLAAAHAAANRGGMTAANLADAHDFSPPDALADPPDSLSTAVGIAAPETAAMTAQGVLGVAASEETGTAMGLGGVLGAAQGHGPLGSGFDASHTGITADSSPTALGIAIGGGPPDVGWGDVGPATAPAAPMSIGDMGPHAMAPDNPADALSAGLAGFGGLAALGGEALGGALGAALGGLGGLGGLGHSSGVTNASIGLGDQAQAENAATTSGLGIGGMGLGPGIGGPVTADGVALGAAAMGDAMAAQAEAALSGMGDMGGPPASDGIGPGLGDAGGLAAGLGAGLAAGADTADGGGFGGFGGPSDASAASAEAAAAESAMGGENAGMAAGESEGSTGGDNAGGDSAGGDSW